MYLIQISFFVLKIKPFTTDPTNTMVMTSTDKALMTAVNEAKSVTSPSATSTSSETTATSTSTTSLDIGDNSTPLLDYVNKGVTYATTPNIVFILADDVGYNSLSEEITPNLKKLSKLGVNLANYYTQSTSTPSRAALLTGRLPLQLGMQNYEQTIDSISGLNLDETTLAEVLKQYGGYTNYIFGKWNLGNASPRYLPTARGFDTFLGFLDDANSYWSKRSVSNPSYKDFLYADSKCYYMYDVDGITDYATNVYRIRAVDAINGHDFDTSSLFMLLSMQSAQAPFADLDTLFPSTIPESYVKADALKHIQSTYSTSIIQQEYYKSLAVLDDAIAAVYQALSDKDVLGNTYIIFTSDNGGCPTSGGSNTPLRGTKGSLYEGGVKVESFIYSPLFTTKIQGMTYNGLFHVTDWFPTILSIVGITNYNPPTGYEINGINQFKSITSGSTSTPRSHVLIQYDFNPDNDFENYWESTPIAIRNSQYKLVHTYESTSFSGWYETLSVVTTEADLKTPAICTTKTAVSDGRFTYYLFDLINDPNETTNLYDSSDDIKGIQRYLYALLDSYKAKAVVPISNLKSDVCYLKWNKFNNYIVPFEEPEAITSLIESKQSATYPTNCGLFSAELALLASFIVQ